MELSSLLNKVRALIAKAEHPNTDPIEAKTFRQGADRLMLKYAIEEALLNETRPAAERSKPGTIELDLSGAGWEMQQYLGDLLSAVARFNRCRVRHYTRYDRERQCYLSKVYGFESDLRFVEMLYTTLRLHMLGALRPGISPTESLEENCYRLHNAGYNWLEIAEMYGWSKEGHFDLDDDRWGKECWRHKETGELKTNWQLGGMHKRAYQKACKMRGEDTKVIPAGGTSTYRNSAVSGYVSGIRDRQRHAASGRGPGTEVALHGMLDDIDRLFRAENPDLYREPEPVAEDDKNKKPRRERKYTPPPFNAEAYQVGHAHAQTADLMAGNKMPGSRTELGS